MLFLSSKAELYGGTLDVAFSEISLSVLERRVVSSVVITDISSRRLAERASVFRASEAPSAFRLAMFLAISPALWAASWFNSWQMSEAAKKVWSTILDRPGTNESPSIFWVKDASFEAQT